MVVLYNPQPKVINTEVVCSVASDSTAVKSSVCLPSLGNRLAWLYNVHLKANFSSQELIWDAQVMNSSVREYLQALTILREKDELYRVLRMTKPICRCPDPRCQDLGPGLDHARRPTWDTFPPGRFMADFLTPKCS